MIKFFICVTFPIAVFLTGCVNTEGTVEIQGNVIDECTKVPIPGKDIIVQVLVERNEKVEPVDFWQFSTDSSGRFTYSLRKIKDARYYNFCFVGDSDYAFKTRKLSPYDLKRNAKYLTFSLNRLVEFKIIISRKSKTPVCDTLSLTWDSDGIDGRILYPYYKIDNFGKKTNPGLTSDLELRWIGGNVKTMIKTRAFADRKTIVWWELLRNGKKLEFKDTITCRRNLSNSVFLTY
jgi:hypothetical protein